MNKYILSILFMLSLFFNFQHSAFASPEKEPIKIVYYWGIGCHFCEKLEPYLNTIEKKYNTDIVWEKHEVFQNQDEFKFFQQLMNIYGIPQNKQGTPTILINNKVLNGLDDIEANLEAEIEKAKDSSNNKNTDIDSQNLSGLIGSVSPQNNSNNIVNNKDTSLTIKAITLAALVDSINPCAIMVLIILLSSLIVYQKENRTRIILTTISFIFAVFITYFALGLGIINIIISMNLSKIIIWFVGLLAIVIGLLNIKDAFFYRKWNWTIEIPLSWRNNLTRVILKSTSPIGAFLSGFLVTMFELPCTGGPYLFGLSLISTYPSIFERITILIFYNFIFILPLIIIAFFVIKGTLSLEKAERLKNKNIKIIHFITGIVMIIIGLWVLLVR